MKRMGQIQANLAIPLIPVTLALGGVLSGCTHSSTPDMKPELARTDGYYVSGDETSERGGVGTYVQRPTRFDQNKRQQQADLDLDAQKLDRELNAPITDQTTTSNAAPIRPENADANGDMKMNVADNVMFEYGSAKLKPDSGAELDRIASSLKADSNRKLRVQGFTDSTGSEHYNLILSQRRAATVKKALIDRGVQADQVRTQGLGEEHPIATNKTDEGRAKNRRVELRMMKKRQGGG